MQRVLCFGGRTYKSEADVDWALRLVEQRAGGMFAIIHGGAKGADLMCASWGGWRGFPVVRIEAAREHYGKAAGAMRNQWMLDLCFPTYAVGFPGGPGSRDMATKCRAADVPLWLPFASVS